MSLFPRLKKNNQRIITNNPGLQRFLFILAFLLYFCELYSRQTRITDNGNKKKSYIRT